MSTSLGPGFALGVMNEEVGRLLVEAVRGTDGEGAEAVCIGVNEIELLEVMSRRETCCKCRGPCFFDSLVRVPGRTAYLCIGCAPTDTIRELLLRHAAAAGRQ